VAPGSFILTSNYDLSNKTFQIEDQVFSKEELVFHSLDSVQLFYTPRTEQTSIKGIISGEGEVDTLSARITDRDRKALLRFSNVFNNNELGPHEQFAFKLTSKIQSIDTSKIHLLNSDDSTKIPFTAVIESNKVIIHFDRTKIKEVNVAMDKGAAASENAKQTEAMSTVVKVKIAKEYGVVNVDASAFTRPIIVELLQNGKVVSKALLISDFQTSFEYLTPGEYQFRVIEDANQNFVWDPIQPLTNEQAEKVYFYTTVSKVRANWEIDVKLSPFN
jgi:hypothetical protein